jgi:hypothetical protein
MENCEATWKKATKCHKKYFLTFPACFSIPIFFSNSNCSDLLDMRKLQEQVKKNIVTKNRSDLSLFE